MPSDVEMNNLSPVRRIIKKQYSSWNVTVVSVKKSMATIGVICEERLASAGQVLGLGTPALSRTRSSPGDSIADAPQIDVKVGVVRTEDKNLSESLHAGARLQKIIRRNRSSEAVGVYAVCSAHPQVIAAAALEAYENESVLHVESTSSQVNQCGGYTGLNPEQFARFVRAQARDAGLSPDRVLLGGDHASVLSL
jgi:hypothetical protein